MKNSKTKELMFILTLVCLVITLITGVSVLIFYGRTLPEKAEEKIYDRYYVMITEDQKSSFWKSVYKGGYAQAQNENVYLDWLGENLPNDYTKDDLIRIAVNSQVDGIIITADERKEMEDLINEAVEKNIPVVTLYGDNSNSQRCSFVGVGSYNMGKEYGNQALKLIRDVIGEKEEIHVSVLVSAYKQNLDQNILCAGIQETIEEEKGGGTAVNIALVPVDETNEFSAEESIRDIFMQEQLPDVLICLNEQNTTCAYQAVVDYNKVGKVHILGYYDSDTILKAIDRNVIDATIAVDAAQMGEYCISALQEYYNLGYTSQYFTAGIRLIGKADVKDYMREKEEKDE